jgi:hypothetical protein
MKKREQRNGKSEDRGIKMIEKAGIAMKNGFYLETSWIISYMLEKKLKKLLGTLENQIPGRGFTLEQSIKRVKYHHISARHPELTRQVEIGLIDEIRTWKNQRNIIFNDIADKHVSQARLKRLAKDGIKLYKEFNRAAKTVKPTDQ